MMETVEWIYIKDVSGERHITQDDFGSTSTHILWYLKTSMKHPVQDPQIGIFKN